MFPPGSVPWLLSHELRLSWRNWLANPKSKNVARGRIILRIVILGFLLFGGYWVAKGISNVPPQASELTLGLIGAIFALLLSFMLSQSLMLITESLYQRGDIDLLLASPLPPWRILLVRMAAIAINVATLYLLLSGAVFVWLPFFGGWAWMGFAPAVLCLSLVATAVGLLLARLMFRLIGPRNTRVVAQIVAGLIGAGFFLAMQAQNFVPYEQRAQLWQATVMRMIPIFGDASSPLSLPARAALGDPVSFAIWLAVSFGAYVLAVWWYGSRFVANAAAIAGVSGKKRVDTRERAMQGGGLSATLVRKEWRLLLRDPLLLSQILVQLLYFIPLFFVFGTRLGADQSGISIPGFASAFVFLATSLAASLAWLTVSAEDAPDLIAAAPVPSVQIDNAKAFAAATPVMALMLLPTLGAIFYAPGSALWLFLGASCAIVSACLIAVWHRVPGNRKNFRRRTRGSLMSGIGQVFVTLGWAGATALAVSGWAIAAIIPAIIALGTLLALHESRVTV